MTAIGVSDGRSITFDCWGAAKGFPIFLLHGTPGSRNGPRPRASVLYRLGVRLICYDRPGYGESSRAEGRTVSDAAWDVLAIADHLGLPEFGVVGRSGGGPHALACAAQLERRVSGVAVLVGVAPSDAKGLDWFDGMTGSNVTDYQRATSAASAVAADLTMRASNSASAVTADLTMRAKQVADDPENLLTFLQDELTEPDRRIVNDFGIRRQLIDAFREAVRCNAA